ncbi:uncharacterized protein CTRU02_209983 [Colletotrichum truncatum]|uniref:Uncharacterized protein n=1 Tax=Colletotrichum truncatum TaxID=5467 RepID=A0ACC3YU47_COLTU|nr:uncharacterized protein CTRU02_02557 [Colletotrichum truncatum]KAF6798583.1 hypothetical protein CTRU02_02557 [Colletotrichum truncatum]
MATPVENRHSPSLHPMWTPQYNMGGFPRSTTRPAPTSYFSSSDRSPKSLPTPVFPSNDGSMRQHERAMVDRLGQRLRQAQRTELSPPKPSPRPRPLSPLAEHSGAEGRRYSAAQISPRRPPAPVMPVSPSIASGRRQTLAAENRHMLLAGMGDEAKRRQSVPTAGFFARSKDAEKRHHLEQLRAWGHVYLGDAKTSDVFVQAVSLRRESNASTNSDNSAGDSSPTRIPTTPTGSSHQTSIRARVRPRALERKPFLIQRTFDIEQLRSTVPDPLPTSPPADLRRRPSMVGPSLSLPKMSSPRPSMARRRSSSAAVHSPLPFNRGLKPGEPRAPSRGATTMPIHLQYARSYLPMLAALIVSGHITTGDVIDLPLPHPEAWANTVAYVYTGQGDLTDAVRENILYLGGKV